MKTLKIVSLILLGAAISSRAQQVNWNGNVMADFKALIAEPDSAANVPAVQGKPVSTQEPQQAVTRLDAEAVGSDRLPWVFGNDIIHDVALAINNTGDRVGASFSLCDRMGDSGCEYLQFVFPQLTVVKTSKSILLGSEKVGRLGGFLSGTGTVKPWRLRHAIREELVDTGFDRVKVWRVSVWLERKS